MQSVMQEQQKLKQAILDFRKIYNNIPGSFNDAQYQLTTDSNYTSTVASSIPLAKIGISVAINTQSTTALGKINSTLKSLTISGGTIIVSDNYLTWQHLSMSNLLIEDYSGYGATSCTTSSANCTLATPTTTGIYRNIPESKKFPGMNVGYNITYTYDIGNETYFGLDTTNHIVITRTTTALSKHLLILSRNNAQNINGIGTGGILSVNIMSMLDQKMDDGDPMSGSIMALNNTATGTSCMQTVRNDNTQATPIDSTPRPVLYQTNGGQGSCIAVFILNELS